MQNSGVYACARGRDPGSGRGVPIFFRGTEGFAFKKDLVKEDGKQAVEGEKLPFVVTELRRSTRKLFLSHLKTYAAVQAEKAAAEVDNTKRAVKKINSTIEKTTLGDIDALAALKDKFEKGE